MAGELLQSAGKLWRGRRPPVVRGRRSGRLHPSRRDAKRRDVAGGLWRPADDALSGRARHAAMRGGAAWPMVLRGARATSHAVGRTAAVRWRRPVRRLDRAARREGQGAGGRGPAPRTRRAHVRRVRRPILGPYGGGAAYGSSPEPPYCGRLAELRPCGGGSRTAPHPSRPMQRPRSGSRSPAPRTGRAHLQRRGAHAVLLPVLGT